MPVRRSNTRFAAKNRGQFAYRRDGGRRRTGAAISQLSHVAYLHYRGYRAYTGAVSTLTRCAALKNLTGKESSQYVSVRRIWDGGARTTDWATKAAPKTNFRAERE